MFHTLSELQEKEKNKGKQIQKKSISTMSKEKSPEDNYYVIYRFRDFIKINYR